MLVDERAHHDADMAETEIHVLVGVIHDLNGDLGCACRLDAVVVVVGVDVVGFHYPIKLTQAVALARTK